MRKTKKYMVKDKAHHTRTSFTLTEEMKEQITKISNSKNIPVAKLVRTFIEKGMNVDKNQSDMDFIRLQLRGEMNIVLMRHEKEIGDMIMDIALYVVPQCKFTADVVQMLYEKKYGALFTDMMEKAQKETMFLLNDDVEN